MIRAMSIAVPGMLMVLPGAVLAQDASSFAANVASSLSRGFAASSFQSPTASGTGWGSIGVGVFGQTINTTGANVDSDVDGSMGINVGFGDPSETVGLDISAGISSLTGKLSDQSFGESGALSAKLSTNLPGLTSFAVGVQGFGRWGLSGSGNQTSVYSALSKGFFYNGHGFIATVGIGDRAFSENASGVGVFGSAGFYFTPQLSLIAEYTGRFANLGVSWAPLKKYPLTVTAGAINVTDKDDFGGVQFGGSLGYGFGF